ncbi:thiamine-phosphate pyrophosphorylase [Faunimonas pinastri]|uniref:Thiamine-phosphate synthase n=1 Tax=Faunimonas pinastri TaxID=1855383 RepID=A0A1H9NQA2_9HYPH|nr:thiamine phosphate synthase [Faunimonas pinastri]SER38214.1 thiamine-phosphate pyrophosphorylase [Faunimonas pinastri]
MRPFDPTLCLVLGPDDTRGRDVLDVVSAAIAGGVTCVQLRWKLAPAEPLKDLARRLIALTREAGVPMLINDRVEVAMVLGADGVHVGQGDMKPENVRRLLGPDVILGLSVENAAQVGTVDPALVDYVGLGPVLETASKKDHALPMGLEGFAAIRPRIRVPVMAIGGVGVSNATLLWQAGANGLAIVSAIAGADDPAEAAAEIRRAFKAQVEAEPSSSATRF